MCCIIAVIAILPTGCRQNVPLSSYLDQPWDTVVCGSRLVLVTPVKMTEDIGLVANYPPDIKQYTKGISCYRSETDIRQLDIRTHVLDYVPSVTCSLDGAARGAIESLRSDSGGSRFTFSEKDIEIGQRHGRLQQGNWIRGDKPVRFMQLIVTEGSSLWQIYIQYDGRDAAGDRLAEQLLSRCRLK